VEEVLKQFRAKCKAIVISKSLGLWNETPQGYLKVIIVIAASVVVRYINIALNVRVAYTEHNLLLTLAMGVVWTLVASIVAVVDSIAYL